MGRYVSRYHVKDSARHVILGTQQFKPNEFASQINLSMENAWGILRCVIDICRKLDEGKYLILKDPNKVRRCWAPEPASRGRRVRLTVCFLCPAASHPGL